MPKENVFQDGPFLNAALICERVLEERDGVKTAVRMVDRVIRTIVGVGIPEQMPSFEWYGSLLIKMKTGKQAGKHELTIRLEDPSGKEGQSVTQTLNLEEGADRGIDLVMNLVLKLEKEGLYWFNVYFNALLLTKVPLRVTYIIQRHGQTESPPIQ